MEQTERVGLCSAGLCLLLAGLKLRLTSLTGSLALAAGPVHSLIPLGRPRDRLGEQPRDGEIVAFCQLSRRGYEAQTLLVGAGFERVSFLDGGRAAWPYDRATKQ